MITSSLFFNEHPVNPEAREYILRLLKQVDMNSKFYQKNKDLIGAVNNGDPNQIWGFKDRRYNALLIYSNGDIIGHAGYQAHFQDNLFHLGIIQGYLQEKERNVSNAKALLSEMVKHSRSGKVDRLRFSKKRAGEVTMRSLQRWGKSFRTIIDMDGWWAYILQESDKEKRELCPTCYRDVIYLDGSFTGPVCPKGHLTSSSELVTLVNSEVIKP